MYALSSLDRRDGDKYLMPGGTFSSRDQTKQLTDATSQKIRHFGEISQTSRHLSAYELLKPETASLL